MATRLKNENKGVEYNMIKQINVNSTIHDIGAKYDADGNVITSQYSSKNHSHNFNTITNRGEAYLTWGGTNFSGSYGPIDAAMVPELGANRLAFMPPAGVIVEYSNDGGSTWLDYELSNTSKIALFDGNGYSVKIGKATTESPATVNSQLRVTINTGDASVYTALNKFCILVSTSGSQGCWCSIRARLESNRTSGKDIWVNFADKVAISGWSGYNIINTNNITTYGNSPTSQYGQVQFIFGATVAPTGSYVGLSISKIFGFGGVGWTTPSTMAKTGMMYTYNENKDVTFPAKVTATSFTGSLTGNADTATSATKIQNNSVTFKNLTLTDSSGTTTTYQLVCKS